MKDQKIISCLWFDGQAEEAANFYTSLFEKSSIGEITRYGKAGHEIHGRSEGAVMTINFEIGGRKFTGLNGGPHFRFTPAISFFVVCETEEETDRLWSALSEGGEVLMPLDTYEWSEKYGWTADRFGLTWQISLGRMEDVGQKVTPCLMYVGEEGEAEDAISLYTSLFDDSEIEGILRYEAGEKQPEGTVKHAQFTLKGDVFMAMDSSPEFAGFTFNEAISLVVPCESQQEVDRFWEGLGRDGDPNAQQCGWLKDRFGVSWQVTPSLLYDMIQDDDAEKVARVTDAYLKMKKFDIEELEAAFEG